MRYFLLTLIFVTSIFADNVTEYFLASKKNKVFCHVGQYSYKMLTQDKAKIVNVNGHDYFKMKGQDLYFLSNSCVPLKNKKELICF